MEHLPTQSIKRIEKRWRIAPRIPDEIDQQLIEFPPLVRQLLFNRGIQNPNQAWTYLAGTTEPVDPFLLINMQTAVDRIFTAIDHCEPIAVYGDYDVDGVTATALLTEVLRTYGADARAYIPNRFEEGYGVNNEALDHLLSEGVRLVITVDCGIRSPGEADHAAAIGLDLIISDHHHPHAELPLPAALAVICPKQTGDTYPEKDLAGVGLAYKIAQALTQTRPLPDGRKADDWLDLVALGTVADLVPLKGENRALVRGGLRVLRRGTRIGICSLAQAANLTVERITGGDIGFILGPRLNAAGRLESALQAYELLVAPDVDTAGLLAQKLDNQNRERQVITSKLQDLSETLISSEDSIGHLLFVADPAFNSGVVGLVASRLVESHYRPAVVAQIGEEFTRASCRSIPEFHITKALDDCSHLMVRHGGHAMAAGFTVRNENVAELKAQLQAIACRELSNLDLRPELRADGEVKLSDLKPNEIFPYLDRLQPTGLENPDAVFVSRAVRVTQARAIGSDKSHLRLTVTDGSIVYDAIAFRQGQLAENMPAKIDILFTFERNTFQGVERIQLNIKDIKPVA